LAGDGRQTGPIRCGAGCNAGRPIPYRHGGPLIPIDLESVRDARLVSEALGGSQAAFEQILRHYQRPVFGLLYRLTGDAALAEDLAQEAFVKVFRNLAAFDVTRRLSSWILRIAHNTGIDALRKHTPRMVPVGVDDGSGPLDLATPDTGDPLERQALADALETAMTRLRPEHRAAMALRYDEGLSFADVAQILGVAEATARSHVHRARKELAVLPAAAGWSPNG
jgi:RNA polymerase sigma-70 factor (ECF subfamily)